MTWKGYESYVPPGAIGEDGRVSKKPNKFNAKKTTLDGITFDSAKEARRWQELRLLHKAGEIEGLNRQVRFDMSVNGVYLGQYVADFVYWQRGASIVEDVKSPATRKLSTYRLKKKLMLACHGIEIQEV